jgi:hypothetical protein
MNTIRYGKPCMTNLPPELGRAIFNQILNSPKPDYDAMEKKARALEGEMLKVREQENAQGNNASIDD